MIVNEQKIMQDARLAIAGVADGLVLTDMITTAEAALAVAVDAERAAVAARTAAEDGLAKAQLASDAASVTPGANVYDAEIALEDAERRARVSSKVLTGATTNRVAAAEALGRARGEAYRPVAVEAAKRLVAACAKVEEARKMLNDAFVDFRGGEVLLLTARQNGAPVRASHHDGSAHRWIVDGNGEVCMPSEAAERGLWFAAGIDVDAVAG